jgi:peroxiredoxin Q/BCP
MSKINSSAPAKKEAGLQVGDAAPTLALTNDKNEKVSLQSFQGKKVVLYFYPKDDTPGCTNEACLFRDNMDRVRGKGAEVLGVSVDSVESHRKFRAKYSLNFSLLSDEEKKAVAAYGVWKQKSMYGRTYMGTERTTFIIDEQGIIRNIFAKVNVKGHVDEVIAALG